MANSIGEADYLPLERCNLPVLLESQLFQHHKHIGVLLFSCSIHSNSLEYIQNTEVQNEDLQKLFDELNSGHKKHIFVVMGVHTHYVLTKITKT